jgi:PAS domain S-box-containing protein
MVNDITQRERAEQSLRESEARFRALIERNLDLILLLDERGAFTFASPSITAILGYTPEGILKMDPLELIHPEDRSRASAALRRLLSRTEEVNQVQFRVRHANRSWRALDANARSLLDDPAVRAVVVNARDVTDRYRLEEQLRQAQKLESIGRLAGGIAHDFNNILTTILGCASFLEESAGPGFLGIEDVREIKRASQRASDLTGQLLAFARKQVISPRSVVLNQLVANAQRFLQRVLGEHIELSTQLEPELWPIRIDPSQLDQLILNLAVNARDAMPSGGRLTIETGNLLLDPAVAAGYADLAPGPHVVLTVSDTGEGMTSEVLPHVFEPFFSTKGAGKGTGLGLATVYGIVRQSGGQIAVQSEVSKGTTFKVYFPRSPDAAPPLEQRSERSSTAPGDERILVVEDDDMVRQLAVRALESAGYAVKSASRPQAVIESVGERPLPFDLLVTDIVMPGMSGKELASQLLACSPGLRVLYISGYTEDAIAHHGELDAGVEFLAKPFSPVELCARVRAVLDRD